MKIKYGFNAEREGVRIVSDMLDLRSAAMQIVKEQGDRRHYDKLFSFDSKLMFDGTQRYFMVYYKPADVTYECHIRVDVNTLLDIGGELHVLPYVGSTSDYIHI
jgi:hypothetical protein